MPGQFGPINLDLFFFNSFFTFNMSNTGIPSVIQTINSNLDSIFNVSNASLIEGY